MKIKVIGCASSMNEVKWLNPDMSFNCEFLDYSYHANPAKLHVKLQELINESQGYDQIIITYGRCSNAVIGLESPQVPLILPKTHDCIGLLLGSNERFTKIFRQNPGTYYFSQGWLDYGRNPYQEYLEYEDKYGQEKAKKLINTLYGRYKKAVLIITKGMKDVNFYLQKVRDIAKFFGWEVSEIEGDLNLLSSLISGKGQPDILFVKPGVKVTVELYTSESTDFQNKK